MFHRGFRLLHVWRPAVRVVTDAVNPAGTCTLPRGADGLTYTKNLGLAFKKPELDRPLLPLPLDLMSSRFSSAVELKPDGSPLVLPRPTYPLSIVILPPLHSQHDTRLRMSGYRSNSTGTGRKVGRQRWSSITHPDGMSSKSEGQGLNFSSFHGYDLAPTGLEVDHGPRDPWLLHTTDRRMEGALPWIGPQWWPLAPLAAILNQERSEAARISDVHPESSSTPFIPEVVSIIVALCTAPVNDS